MSRTDASSERLRLEALHRYRMLDSRPEPGLDDITGLAAYICATPMAIITLIDSTRQWFKSRIGITVSETPREIAFCNHAIAQKDVFIVHDAHTDPRFSGNPLVTGDPYIRFYAGMPLRTGDGFSIGTLAVLDQVPRTLSPEQMQALRVLAARVVTEFELRRSLEQREQAIVERDRSQARLRESHHELERRVQERTEALNAAYAQLQLKLEENAKKARESQAIIDSLPGVFYLFTADGRYLRWNRNLELVTGYGRDEILQIKPEDFVAETDKGPVRAAMEQALEQGAATLEAGLRTRSGDHVPYLFNGSRLEISGEVCISGMGIDISARRRAEDTLRLRDRAIEASVNAIIITDAEGNIASVNPAFERITGYDAAEAIGRNCRFLQRDDRLQTGVAALRKAIRERREGSALLRNYRRNGELFWNDVHIAPVPDADGSVTHFVGVLNDVTKLKRYEEQLERQANFDALTALANRQVLSDRIQQAVAFAARHGEMVAVGFIDLDNFKFINDSLGHDIGDELLKQVAQRLACSLREQDTVARYGGDEFAFVIVGQRDDNGIAQSMERILKTIGRPFMVNGHQLFVSCSIGISFYPKDGHDSATLLKNADAAMYRAKDRGRNNFQFYTAAMNQRVTHRLALESRLRQALERNEFVLHYQPKVDIRSGRVVGAEALLRWLQPNGELMGPADFIPLAEETGLIVPIGEWALQTACRDNMALQAAGLSPIRIAVNISARQFDARSLSVLVRGALRSSRMDAGLLELTESLVMQNPEEAIRLLLELKEVGLHIAIDDFGTGYSSLSYLQRFPVDHLKIDQSFVRDIGADLNDAIIARAVISLGHSLGMSVIAEGVCSAEQLAFLQQHECDQMQGYLFSRPVELGALTSLIRENHAAIRNLLSS